MRQLESVRLYPVGRGSSAPTALSNSAIVPQIAGSDDPWNVERGPPPESDGGDESLGSPEKVAARPGAARSARKRHDTFSSMAPDESRVGSFGYHSLEERLTVTPALRVVCRSVNWQSELLLLSRRHAEILEQDEEAQGGFREFTSVRDGMRAVHLSDAVVAQEQNVHRELLFAIQQARDKVIYDEEVSRPGANFYRKYAAGGFRCFSEQNVREMCPVAVPLYLSDWNYGLRIVCPALKFVHSPIRSIPSACLRIVCLCPQTEDPSR